MNILLLLGLGVFTQKPTVLMIHGAGGGAWEYKFWRPVFENRGYRVVAKDLQPQPKGLGKTTLKHYIDQVSTWCPKGKPVVLVGASMGGIIALKASEVYKTKAIILINSVVPKASTKSKNVFNFPPIIRWANGPLSDTEVAMPDSDRETILWAWKKWRDESGQVMNELRAGVEATKPSKPTLVIIGEEDTDIPPAKSNQLATWLNASIHSYPGMSHVGPLLGRQAEAVADRAVDWLELQPLYKEPLSKKVSGRR